MPAPQPILIGPVGTGKSSLAPIVAKPLGLQHVDLDSVAEPYYEEVDRGRARLNEVGAQLGDLGAYRWWQTGHPHAVRRVLEDYPASVIALGAGHTVYEDERLFEEVRDALKPHNPILVLPSPDPDTSIRVLRERCVAQRDRDWILNGVDILEHWVRSPQNGELATITVFTEGRQPDETADEIIRLLK